MMLKFSALPVCFALMLSGCAALTTPDVQPDIAAISLPDHWLFAATPATATTTDEAWWQAYGSTELNQLVAQALERNQDIAIAALNLQKAQLNRAPTLADRGIQRSGSIGSSLSHQFHTDTDTHGISGSLTVGYQVDLWRKLSTARNIRTWQAQASAEDLLAAKLSAEAEVVRSYLTLAWLDEQIRSAKQTQHYLQNQYQRQQAQYRLGNISRLNLIQSRQRLLQNAQQQNHLAQQRAEQQMTIATLLGQAPAQLTLRPPALAQWQMPTINPVLPAQLLARRPDLRAAQYRLQQQLGDVALAERAFYPDINLTAGLSMSSGALARLLDNPVGTLATSLALPFLQADSINIKAAQSRLSYQQALTAFAQKLYRALKDVNSALLNIRRLQQEQTLNQAALDNAKQNRQITEAAYRLGAKTWQEVSDSEHQQRNAEQEMLANRYRQLLAALDLMLALGGSSQ